MDGQVTFRPVMEDDLSWLENSRNDPVATGPHEWHGWQDHRSQRRRWEESRLLGDSGGTLMVMNAAEDGGGILGHPMGVAAGVRSLQQAWEAAAQNIPLKKYAVARPELASALELFGT